MVLPIRQSGPAEADVFDRAKAGDLTAFETLIRPHERAVLRLSARLMGSLEDGQDVAQETFLKLHRQLAQLGSINDVGPWLYRVAVNGCLDARRKQKRSRLAPIDGESMTLTSEGLSPEAALARKQERDLLRSAIETLSDREQAVIALRAMEELPTKAVAKLLGSTESTVRVQLSVARAKIRRFFEAARRAKS